MSQKSIKITGWVLTIVLALLFAMSAFMKLTLNEAALEQAKTLGVDPETFRLLGIVEIISIILFLVPRTGVVGALLLIAYMGGAITAHLMHQQSIVMGVAIEALIWITTALRFPELKQRLFTSAQKNIKNNYLSSQFKK